MSLDKSIAHGKERRKPYGGTKAYDCTCRNHGSCQWCVENRQHKFRDKEMDAMRVEIKYFADDDTEFESKKECEAYEKELGNRFNSVQFFDEDCKPIPNTLERIESDSFFIRIHDAMNAQRLFHWLTWRCSFQEPECSYDRGDVLHWDARHDCWENLTKERERISEYIRRIEGR